MFVRRGGTGLQLEIVPQNHRFYMKGRLCIDLGKYVYFAMRGAGIALEDAR